MGKSHLTRGAWIEIVAGADDAKEYLASHLTRGAWIEIVLPVAVVGSVTVAPHTRCVD